MGTGLGSVCSSTIEGVAIDTRRNVPCHLIFIAKMFFWYNVGNCKHLDEGRSTWRRKKAIQAKGDWKCKARNKADTIEAWWRY